MRKTHRGQGGPERQRPHFGRTACDIDYGLIDVAQRPYVVRTHMKDVRLAWLESEHAGLHQIFGIDELVAIAAVADDPDSFAVVDKFEQDGEQAEPATIDNRWAAQDDDVEIARVAGKNLFGGQLGLSIDLGRRR